jgi:hypothetical protein
MENFLYSLAISASAYKAQSNANRFKLQISPTLPKHPVTEAVQQIWFYIL